MDAGKGTVTHMVSVTFRRLGCWIALAMFVFGQSSFAAKPMLTLSTEDGPPHMIQASNDGIDIDIVRSVLVELGYDVDVVYAPLERCKLSVKQGLFDLTVPTFVTSDSDGFYVSEPVINYRPTVFSKANTKFSSLKDIQDLRVATFQGARGYLGPQFVSMSRKNRYVEYSNMSVLSSLLLKDRTDVVVLDYYIFYYYLREMNQFGRLHEIQENAIIPSVQAAVGFHSKSLRDQFNQAFDKFKKVGGVKKIERTYIGDVPQWVHNP